MPWMYKMVFSLQELTLLFIDAGDLVLNYFYSWVILSFSVQEKVSQDGTLSVESTVAVPSPKIDIPDASSKIYAIVTGKFH